MKNYYFFVPVKNVLGSSITYYSCVFQNKTNGGIHVILQRFFTKISSCNYGIQVLGDPFQVYESRT